MDTKWKGYKNYDHYFLVDQEDEWIDEIVKSEPEYVTVGKKLIWNIPCSFDIETSSYYQMGQKRATMYLWSMCINGSTILGRTWLDFKKILERLEKAFHTDHMQLIIYVHNLGYEFQFMRKWLDIDEVFAVKERRPIHVVLKNGIEFKCSYILSNYALYYIGANLLSRYKVQKDVGALDYSKLRHSNTPLTNEEIWYSVHDVQVVTSFIQEKIENEHGIENIPLTNTGYVRRYCRNYCFGQYLDNPAERRKMAARYHEMLTGLSIQSACEYDQLKLAFGGGFTHAAPFWSGKLIEEVGSADEASAYPGVMLRKKFPMSPGVFAGAADLEDLDWLTNHNMAFVMTIYIEDVVPKFQWENYISESHCQKLSKDAVINNGRVASASFLQTVITDVDWDIIKKCYEWKSESLVISNLRYYKYGYLPKPFVLSILHLYANKTSLKGVEGKETEYMVSKNMINASYGMAVTNIIRDEFEYENADWSTKHLSDAEKAHELESYNDSYNRFLFYAWGVWVTAHARHCLWDAIFEFKQDYVYSDTDSIKGINFDNHKTFFTLYNTKVEVELRAMCRYHNIPFSLCEPKTKKGEKKLIGIYEYEGEYQLFKTIGAKRYMFEKNNELWFTISGVNKYKGMPYLLWEYAIDWEYIPEFREIAEIAYSNSPLLVDQAKENMQYIRNLRLDGKLDYENVFDHFSEGLFFPPDATGKNTLTYVDTPFIEECVDFLGNRTTVMEMSYIHMEPQSYYMSQTEAYLKFLEGFQDASI